MISVFVIHATGGRCASVATVRRPYLYDLQLSQISCVNARFPPIPQSAQSVGLEEAIRLTKSEIRRTKSQIGTIGRPKVSRAPILPRHARDRGSPVRLAPSDAPNRRGCIGAAPVRVSMTGRAHADSSGFVPGVHCFASRSSCPGFLAGPSNARYTEQNYRILHARTEAAPLRDD